MENKEVLEEIARLNFEDIIWVVFIIISALNISGDSNEKEFLRTNNSSFKNNANKIFTFTLIVALFIYIYFFARNYKAFKEAPAEEKDLLFIKLFGSSLLIAGVLLLIYFQVQQTSFIGTPAI